MITLKVDDSSGWFWVLVVVVRQAALRKAESELTSLKQQKEEQNRVNKLRKR